MVNISDRRMSRLLNNTLAVVLAGGRGSRLADLTGWRAKPAVPFGGKYRIIDFALSNCINSNIRRICVLTQYKSHYLFKHIQQGWSHFNHEHGEFVDLIPAQQWVDKESWFLGTADAVYQSLDIIESHAPDYVLVLAGDHIYNMDYSEMLASHADSGADFTIACNRIERAEAGAYGVMGVDDNFRVVNFEEKPDQPRAMPGDPHTSLVSMGIYIFPRQYLREQLERDAEESSSTHDFGNDLIPHAIEQGHQVNAYAFRNPASGAPDYWRDVGTVEAYYQANMELLLSDPPLHLDDRDWPVFTYQPQTPPARFIGIDEHNRLRNVLISGGCVVNRSALANTILFSNVRVENGCTINGSLLLPGSTIGEGCRLDNVIIDNGCNIPPGSVIGENASEDRKRFNVTESGVVIVTRIMLGAKTGLHLRHLDPEWGTRGGS
jgi:glucose-1-phosphate adenylyltransferase